MKKIFRSYVFWTYQRGSAHYDVMVTLILLFIFVSPRFINFTIGRCSGRCRRARCW